ncbi:PDDEXK-like family protein [Flavobacterium ajazii]|uniref:PD-(D/E)XK nuclease family protein n=1 Tax=Flavobacterium ajazii TaxID=2692318 RepID=UPI0013D1A8FF|nr:PD-(D/E)XK nuclease family protein [Flavobacterium ajazii]
MNLKSLEDFLINKTIPIVKNKIGFLEIIRKQHYENINSNLYAHFLSSEITEVRSLFLEALLLLIIEKTGKHFSFINDRVSTEVATTSNGRIDIVLEDYHYGNVILIENKIYHYLHNDLLDYWNHYKIDASKKVGVLLTLYEHEIPENVKGNFINITHIEWINKVKENFYPESFTDNYKIYISDFINTIENLTRINTMNESARFYFENTSQVIKANETLNEAHLFLNNQFQLIANKIGWQSYGNEVTWRNFWDEDNHIDTYFTLITKDLVEGNNLSFMLILELNRKDKDREEEIKERFKTHSQFLDKKRGESKGTYVHFLCKEYTLTIDELTHFSDIVLDKIKNDFADITIDVIRYLYPQKDISAFENQVLNKI